MPDLRPLFLAESLEYSTLLSEHSCGAGKDVNDDRRCCKLVQGETDVRQRPFPRARRSGMRCGKYVCRGGDWTRLSSIRRRRAFHPLEAAAAPMLERE